MNVVVFRSSLRLMFLALLAVPAILLAVDMMWSHRWYPAPETWDRVVGTTIDAFGSTVEVKETVLSADGQAQQRRDRAFGTVLLLSGVAAMGLSVNSLLRPRPLLRAGDEGISIRVDGARHLPRLFPWEAIAEIRSGVRDDEGAAFEVLSIRFHDADMVPVDPEGGLADPPWLHLWTDDWEVPAHRLAPLLEPGIHRAAGAGR